MWRRRGRSILTLGLILGATVGTAAIAASIAAGQDTTSSLEAELRAAFCGTDDVCRVINTLADPKASDAEADTDAEGQTLAGLLAAHGRPADACPIAKTAYGATGRPVDAFLGPCPSAKELQGMLP